MVLGNILTRDLLIFTTRALKLLAMSYAANQSYGRSMPAMASKAT